MWSGKAKAWKQCQRVLTHAQSLFYICLWTDKANHCQAGEARTLWIPHRHLRCNGLSIFVMHFTCHGSVWGHLPIPRVLRGLLTLFTSHWSCDLNMRVVWMTYLGPGFLSSIGIVVLFSLPKPPYLVHSSLLLPWVYLLSVLNWSIGR